jgi:hypothetical protein
MILKIHENDPQLITIYVTFVPLKMENTHSAIISNKQLSCLSEEKSGVEYLRGTPTQLNSVSVK